MVCVLFSGGLDSMVLAELAFRDGKLGALFHMSYGQRASAQEYRAARKYAIDRGIALERAIVSVRGLDDMNQAPGVRGARVVPARNLILLAHALNYAAANQCTELWYGACKDDCSDYPDCRAEFVADVSKISEWTEGVSIRAPLIDKTKSEILSQGRSLGITDRDFWSCYAPRNDSPCGQCNSCVANQRVKGER